jgi:predicted amidohydrolase YtcJ
MLITRASLLDGRVADIRLAGEITQLAPRLEPGRGETILDARFGAVLPGLHDHHLHLRAAAAALESLAVGPPAVRAEAQFTRTVATAVAGTDGWIRATGYHESVAGELNRARLDVLQPATPMRVQHRSGALWILNSAALARIGHPDHVDGRLVSTDPRLGRAIPRREPDLRALGRRLTSFGVTGVTDATPDLGPGDIDSLATGLTQKVRCLAPGKRILRDDQLDLEELSVWVAERHADDVPVALHCVTAAQLVVAIAALRSAGRHSLDRVEHAAMVPDDCVADLADSGVTVITQPNFVAERGDTYRHEVPVEQHSQLWRAASLARAGIPVAGSTDAPFGDLDPWAAMRAAVTRATASGDVLGPDERVAPLTALQMFLGTPARPAVLRSIAPEQPGDVCVLAPGTDEALRALASDMVLTTVVAGEIVEAG